MIVNLCRLEIQFFCLTLHAMTFVLTTKSERERIERHSRQRKRLRARDLNPAFVILPVFSFNIRTN